MVLQRKHRFKKLTCDPILAVQILDLNGLHFISDVVGNHFIEHVNNPRHRAIMNCLIIDSIVKGDWFGFGGVKVYLFWDEGIVVFIIYFDFK